jgi:hypothetical protein
MKTILLRGLAAILIALAATALACSSEEAAIGTPEPAAAEAQSAQAVPAPAASAAAMLGSIKISDSHPVAEDIVSVVHRKKPDGDLALGYTWRLNGDLVGSAQELTVPNRAKSGDVLSVIVVAQAGRKVSEPVEATVEIDNSPPLWVSLGVSPSERVIGGVTLTAYPEAADRDGDELSYQFEWQINRRPVYGENQVTFTPDRVKRGDQIRVVVNMNDGDSSWEPKASEEIAVANMAPQIVSAPPSSWPGDRFEYQVRVQDPDGDSRIRYKLETGPRGMTIDAFGGKLVWDIPASDREQQVIEIAVTDGNGGEARQRFEIGSAGSPASPKR